MLFEIWRAVRKTLSKLNELGMDRLAPRISASELCRRKSSRCIDERILPVVLEAVCR
jgi:hypothetical protein